MRSFFIASLCVALGGFTDLVLAQDVRLSNPANTTRKQWVDVALPQTDAASLPQLCRLDPQGFTVLKGCNVGVHSTMFHVLADIGAHQSITGRIVGVSNASTARDAWRTSDWVGDSTPDVLPLPALLDQQGVEHRLQPGSFDVIEDLSPARRVFHLHGRMQGTPLVYDSYIYVYSCQDVVRIECTFTNSDPATPDLSFYFSALWLESGEYLRIDYLKRLGLIEPIHQLQVPSHPSYDKFVQLLSPARVLGRGEQIHVSGSMLCLPAQGRPLVPQVYHSQTGSTSISVADRISTLFAAYEQPPVGVYLGWQGKWLAYGLTPEMPTTAGNQGWTESNNSWNGFQSLMQQSADLYTQRPLGLNRHASNTGAQEDFGACKGAYAVTVGDPRFLYQMGYSVQELFLRPFHYRELDGSPLRATSHPGLQTWGQIINCRTTQDTVGLSCPLPYSWPSDGWTTYDDQHRSQNNFNALLALTGSYALRDQLRDLAEVDMTQVPNRMDSPRAEGRLGIAWANMVLLLDQPADRANLLAHISARTQAISNIWLGRNFVNNPAKPIRILQTGSDPSFLEPNNTRTTAIIVWEHSIATMGFYGMWRVTGDQRLHDLAAEISKMIVNHCIYQEGGHWLTCTAVRYLLGAQEGDALPASTYYTGSPDIHVGGVSFWNWILPAVLICRDLHPNDTQLVARCNAILQDQAPNGPTNWQNSEWWAVVPR